MTDRRWLIVRVVLAHERHAAENISRLPAVAAAWCPLRVRLVRSHAHRRGISGTSGPLRERRHPVLPGTIFALASPAAIPDIIVQRWVRGIDRHADLSPCLVPDGAVAAFRDAIESLNERTLMLASLGEQRKARKTWAKLQDGLAELLARSRRMIDDAA